MSVFENVHELFGGSVHASCTVYLWRHARLQPVWLRDFERIALFTANSHSWTFKSRTLGPRFDGYWFATQSPAGKIGISLTPARLQHAAIEPQAGADRAHGPKGQLIFAGCLRFRQILKEALLSLCFGAS